MFYFHYIFMHDLNSESRFNTTSERLPIAVRVSCVMTGSGGSCAYVALSVNAHTHSPH